MSDLYEISTALLAGVAAIWVSGAAFMAMADRIQLGKARRRHAATRQAPTSNR